MNRDVLKWTMFKTIGSAIDIQPGFELGFNFYSIAFISQLKLCIPTVCMQVERMMKKSLHTVTSQSVAAYPTKPRDAWLLDWPGQVVLAVSQIFWTRDVVHALVHSGADGLKAFSEKYSRGLQDEVQLVRGNLTKLQRLTLGALVVIDVHARDVLVEMARDGVHDETDFAWQAQLRYAWEGDTVIVRMLNAVARYGYEYLGNSSRLVITPLTDRCYRCRPSQDKNAAVKPCI